MKCTQEKTHFEKVGRCHCELNHENDITIIIEDRKRTLMRNTRYHMRIQKISSGVGGGGGELGSCQSTTYFTESRTNLPRLAIAIATRGGFVPVFLKKHL